MPPIDLIAPTLMRPEAEEAGFRFGNKGTHTSRTMMLNEISHVLASTHPGAKREDYATAIIEENCLGKPTVSTRKLSNQRLGELYGLDPSIPIFRVLHMLWEKDPTGRPLLALLCSLARDPLLSATADSIVQLRPGAEFLREPIRDSLRSVVGERLNDSTLNKVVRNTASSWTQSGHLVGRSLKSRQKVQPTPACVAYSLYLAYLAGFRGPGIFTSGWIATLDIAPSQAQNYALEAKRIGLLDIRMAGDVIDIKFDRLEAPVRST